MILSRAPSRLSFFGAYSPIKYCTCFFASSSVSKVFFPLTAAGIICLFEGKSPPLQRHRPQVGPCFGALSIFMVISQLNPALQALTGIWQKKRGFFEVSFWVFYFLTFSHSPNHFLAKRPPRSILFIHHCIPPRCAISSLLSFSIKMIFFCVKYGAARLWHDAGPCSGA
jgi:hypothetical protein